MYQLFITLVVILYIVGLDLELQYIDLQFTSLSFSIAYEIFNMYKFVKDCEINEKKSEEKISTLQNSQKNVTILRSNMMVLKTNIEVVTIHFISLLR